MSEEMKALFVEISAQLDAIHGVFYQVQNSGEVEGYAFSEFTMDADNLREKFNTFIEKIENQKCDPQVTEKR